jgi:CPA2 family monovalent cation:H+ antiporter-2
MADVLLEAGVVFAILAVGGALAARIGQSVIPAYILAGVLLGPNAPTVAGVSLAIVETREFITLLSELGIVFLLFFIGLEFNLDRLLSSRTQIVRAGVIDLGNFLVGFGVGLLVGFSAFEALFLAGAVYISSSAIITKTLIDLGWIADPESEATLGVLVFEDVAVAVYLALLAAVAVGGGDAASIAASLGRSFAFIGALVVLAAVGTPLLERLYDVQSTERFLIQVVAAAVLTGGVALALGVSEAVAAFFLGSAFGATSHAERIERVITSERDLYAAVFFLSIGLVTDPSTFGSVLLPLAVLVVVTAATKVVSGFYGGRAYGLSDRRSLRVGLALVARGEFSLVIAALAVSAGTTPVLSRTIPALVVGYVLVMSILGTTLMRHSDVIERALGLTPAAVGKPPGDSEGASGRESSGE